MMAGHMNLRRVSHRVAEELHATRAIAGETSWRDALDTLRAKVDIQVMNRNGFQEPPAVRDRLIRKHETVLEYLEARSHGYYESYDYAAELPPGDPDLEGRIWLCWWQGIECAPAIVRACVESICRNADGHTVTIITDRNYRDYVHIPDWVMRKVAEGIITRTNLSDLLRLSLLAEHGGLWLDATFFCCGPLGDLAFGQPLFSIKRPDYLHASVASGYFAGYSLACDTAHRRVFATIRDFFLEYWQKNDFMVDYLLVDYMIVLAQRHDPSIAGAFDAIRPNNPLCDELGKCLGEPFDRQRWQELSSNTSLFKLTWKQSFPVRKGEVQTFYGALLGGDLT